LRYWNQQEGASQPRSPSALNNRANEARPSPDRHQGLYFVAVVADLLQERRCKDVTQAERVVARKEARRRKGTDVGVKVAAAEEGSAVERQAR
jgi:hypothetical protein